MGGGSKSAKGGAISANGFRPEFQIRGRSKSAEDPNPLRHRQSEFFTEFITKSRFFQTSQESVRCLLRNVKRFRILTWSFSRQIFPACAHHNIITWLSTLQTAGQGLEIAKCSAVINFLRSATKWFLQTSKEY